MEQHPIPQNVSQYQFRLIGNMTLKQFAMLGACLLFAFVITKITIVPVIFRWPVAGFFAALGGALAFLPFEERSLDVWLINFIKSIYSPTQLIWKRAGALPEYFSFVRSSNLPPAPIKNTVADRARFANYIQTMNQKPQTAQDRLESQALQKINSLLSGNKSNNVSPPSPKKPSQVPPRPPIQTPTPINQASSRGFKIPNQVQKGQQVQKPVLTTSNNMIKAAPSIDQGLNIKSLHPVVKKPKGPRPKYISDIQMPITPDTPNTITGMTATKEGQLIPNVIVEILDKDNLPTRAIKSNKLGQFFIATPLKSGNYTIKAEHDQYVFDTIKLELNGDIIKPLKIICKQANNP
jgi:hypothetical protein